jgi:hypothetical protein
MKQASSQLTMKEPELAKTCNGEEGTLYRVLYSDSLKSDWNKTPVPNSSHHRPPVQWTDTWDKTHSTENPEESYPLLCLDFGKLVKFTARARQVYLAEPGKFTTEFFRNNWNSREVYEVGQLDGICAFQSAQASFEWIATDSSLKGRAHTFQYVVFKGVIVSEAPETTGVVAHVAEKTGTPMTLEQFKATTVRTVAEA